MIFLAVSRYREDRALGSRFTLQKHYFQNKCLLRSNFSLLNSYKQTKVRASTMPPSLTETNKEYLEKRIHMYYFLDSFNPKL